MEIKEIREKFKESFNNVIENSILTSFLVLVLLTIVVITLSLPYYIENFHAYYGQVLVEAHGMLFDIAVIGILIFWLNRNGEMRQRIRTYKDEIDDFRLWESEEAAFRTVGNIKRLNRNKITDVNLVNCYLGKTNLNYVNLKGSNLNNANVSSSFLIECNLNEARLNQTNLENSNLNQATLIGAFVSGANFKDGFMIKAVFDKAFLIKANFENAMLMEASFKDCYLTGANFDNANLYKADLRGANGLTIEQLANVKSLYLAKFDKELEEKVARELPHLKDA
ncbi:MAG: pentapeptide repeat-containing protein [Bacteroidota bacterium]